MHIQTKVVLAIPSYEIGGIQNLLECFLLLLREFLNLLDYERVANEECDFFSCHQSQINFVRTDDKSTLRYVSDFKLALEIEAKKRHDISQALCDRTSEYWLNNLIKDSLEPTKYTTPLKLLTYLIKYGKKC